MHTVGVICLISLSSTAVTMWERKWRENVLQVSGELYRSANPCNRTTVFSLSWRARDTWMVTQSLALILELIRLPSKLLGQMHYIPWLIEIAFFPPSFFFKLDMLCWRSVFLRRDMRAVDLFQSQLLKQSCLHCDTSAFILSGCDSLKKTWR